MFPSIVYTTQLPDELMLSVQSHVIRFMVTISLQLAIDNFWKTLNMGRQSLGRHVEWVQSRINNINPRSNRLAYRGQYCRNCDQKCSNTLRFAVRIIISRSRCHTSGFLFLFIESIFFCTIYLAVSSGCPRRIATTDFIKYTTYHKDNRYDHTKHMYRPTRN